MLYYSPVAATTSCLMVLQPHKAAGTARIAVGIYKRKMSIPVGVIRGGFTEEEGFESTREIRLSDR